MPVEMSNPQFHLELRENGKVSHQQDLPDPFHTTHINVRGWRAAWLVLRGRLDLTVMVTGTPKAYRVVMGGDYTPDPPGEPVAMEFAGTPA